MNAGVCRRETIMLPETFYGSDGAYAKLSLWVRSKGLLREALAFYAWGVVTHASVHCYHAFECAGTDHYISGLATPGCREVVEDSIRHLRSLCVPR
jgi:hypothetical protein